MTIARQIHIVPSMHRLLNVDEYHRMIEAGVFEEDEYLELVEGVLVTMTPQTVQHARAIQRLSRMFFLGLGTEFVIRVQLPLTLGMHSEPEPDLAVVTEEEANRTDRHPSDALLVVEVSLESLEKDRDVKGALYASAGIPEYWIVDLGDRSVEVRRDPDEENARYRSSTIITEGELAPTNLPGLVVDIGVLFA